MHNMSFRENYSEYGSSSRYGRVPMMFSKNDTEHMLHVRRKTMHMNLHNKFSVHVRRSHISRDY